MLELAEQDFKAAPVTVLEDVKKNIYKKNEKMGTIVRESQTVKRNPMEIL